MLPEITADCDSPSHPERIAGQSSSEEPLLCRQSFPTLPAVGLSYKSKDSVLRGSLSTSRSESDSAGPSTSRRGPYSGFDAEKMTLKILSALMTKFPDERLDDQGLPKGLLVNLQKLITLGLIRGNNLQKIKTTISDVALNFILDVAPILGLEDSIKNNKEAVTLTRICICFPVLTMKVAHFLEYKGPADREVSKDFPSALRPLTSGLIIPSKGHHEGLSDNQVAKLRLAFIYYSCLFTRNIARVKPTVNKAMFERQIEYVDDAIKQSPASEYSRHMCLSDPSFEILDDRGLKPIIGHYAECALAVQEGREIPEWGSPNPSASDQAVELDYHTEILWGL